eukprot:TRINITY_DN6569_c0_g1_i1.p1 TRINITY_DN6569_c0_g1~~TRINITY_DN6569_c0_g1_i1.p1  ORF type:complete len:358 (+),score=41.27 TRINITY_DN6569_c0_g1_i1:486-1559(+)
MSRLKPESEAYRTESEKGPLKWMAPESLENQIYSQKTDVFSYGVCLYEIVSRSEPWSGLFGSAAALRVLKGERMPIPRNPPVLARLMEMCWKKDPANRPDFHQILQMLETTENSNTISTVHSSSQYILTPRTTDSNRNSNQYNLTPNAAGEYVNNYGVPRNVDDEISPKNSSPNSTRSTSFSVQSPSSMVCRIAVVGSVEVGKSSMVQRLVYGTFTDTAVSIVGHCDKTMDVNGSPHDFRITEIKLEEVTENIFSYFDGYILMYNVASRESFENARELRKKMPQTLPVPIALVAHKSDLISVVSKEEGEAFADAFKMLFFTSSSKSNQKVEEPFASIAALVDQNRGKTKKKNACVVQ